MKTALNVLVTAASRRVPLVRAFQRALRRAGVAGKVVATDVNELSPAVHVADLAYRVPLSADAGYLAAIDAICSGEGIGLIVPTIDDELPLFSEAAPRLLGRGIVVAVSPLDTTLACNDKRETCRRLQAGGVAAVDTFLPSELPAGITYPLFIKPRFGRGSVGAYPVAAKRFLPFFCELVEQPVIQRFLDGPEYTVDLFCDAGGTPISAVPRRRVVIRAGVIDRGHTCSEPALVEIALACARVFRFFGAINIQCRVVDGVPTVFEINPRFSGGIPLTIAAGADFPYWLVRAVLGHELVPAVGEFTNNLWMTNYEEGIFLAQQRLDVLRPVPPTAGTGS